MACIAESELNHLYKSEDISSIWRRAQALDVIKHPDFGCISPNRFRHINSNNPCPYCAKRMVHGYPENATNSKEEAKSRGYEYINSKGEKVINGAGDTYFHPNYITIDHKINKARCPQKMFDFENLQAVCWRCNNEKGDDNTFDSKFTRDYLNSLVEEKISQYINLK